MIKKKIEDSGRELVIVPQNAFDKTKDSTDVKGNPMGTFDLVLKEYNDIFEYIWVSPKELSLTRKSVWDKHLVVLDWLGDKKWRNKIKISKTINEYISGDTKGVYDTAEDAIIIKETVLDNANSFYEVLIHEYIHATTGCHDNSRYFENELGKIIGKMGGELFNNKLETNEIRTKEKSWFWKLIDDLRMK